MNKDKIDGPLYDYPGEIDYDWLAIAETLGVYGERADGGNP